MPSCSRAKIPKSGIPRCYYRRMTVKTSEPFSDSVKQSIARPRAWIVGASSGVGAATARRLAKSGYDLVISARRRPRLDALKDELEALGVSVEAIPLDASDRSSVNAAIHSDAVSTRHLDAFVYATGANVKKRHWNGISDNESRDVYETNVLAAMTMLDPVIEGMRTSGGGAIVLVSSMSSWKIVPHAGVAYASSKAALTAIAHSINSEEAGAGLRACNLCPGEIDSEFMQHRPQPPSDERRATMLTPDDVARAIEFVVTSPPHVTVNEMVISPCR